MVQTSRVLVGGGTGFIGRHLVRCLKDGGAKVRILTRKTGGKPDHISWDAIRDKGLPEDTTAVVNLSGRNILEPALWTESFKRDVYSSRVDTNRLLANAIHKAPVKPKVFVTVSGVGYYKPSESVEYDETWTQPDDAGSSKDVNYLMKLVKDWEKASELIEEHAPSTRRVIIRAGAVIGRDGGLVQKAKLQYLLGAGGPIGSGEQWFPWIHVDDLADMFKFAIINDHVSGIINGVAPEVIRNKDFAKTFGQVLNRPAFIPTPAFAIRLAFGADRAVLLLEGMRVKSRSGLLGFRCQYPSIREACEQSIK